MMKIYRTQDKQLTRVDDMNEGGQGAYEDDAKADTQALADVLAAQGLPAHLEVWGGDVSHEWYWWGKMLSLFVPRILEK